MCQGSALGGALALGIALLHVLELELHDIVHAGADWIFSARKIRYLVRAADFWCVRSQSIAALAVYAPIVYDLRLRSSLVQALLLKFADLKYPCRDVICEVLWIFFKFRRFCGEVLPDQIVALGIRFTSLLSRFERPLGKLVLICRWRQNGCLLQVFFIAGHIGIDNHLFHWGHNLEGLNFLYDRIFADKHFVNLNRACNKILRVVRYAGKLIHGRVVELVRHFRVANNWISLQLPRRRN